ncbi:MAG: hypothetical protein AAGC67_17305, partial [Myxococcota bacterium]
MTRLVLCIVGLTFPALFGTSVLRALEFDVDSLVDAPDAAIGDGVCADAGGRCSLRAAFQEANAHPTGIAHGHVPHAITLSAGIHALSIAGADEDASATGDLDLFVSVELLGAGRETTIVDAAQLDRVIDVHAGALLRAEDLAFRNGRVEGPTTGGALRFRFEPGVDSAHRPPHRLVRMTMSNSAAHRGGALSNLQRVVAEDVRFERNEAFGFHVVPDPLNPPAGIESFPEGGAIENGDAGLLVLLASTLAEN